FQAVTERLSQGWDPPGEPAAQNDHLWVQQSADVDRETAEGIDHVADDGSSVRIALGRVLDDLLRGPSRELGGLAPPLVVPLGDRLAGRPLLERTLCEVGDRAGRRPHTPDRTPADQQA